MPDRPPLDDLFVRTEAAQFAFLLADLEVCYTLLEHAHNGCRSGMAQARTNAEKGYLAISRLVLNFEHPEHRKKIQLRLDTLRAALDQLAARDEA